MMTLTHELLPLINSLGHPRAQRLFLALGALVRPGVNFLVHGRNFRRKVKNFRRAASNTWSTHPKSYGGPQLSQQ